MSTELNATPQNNLHTHHSIRNSI